MDLEEFSKLLSENRKYWNRGGSIQQILTPIFLLEMWLKHGNSIGCFITPKQSRRARFLIDRLNEDRSRYMVELSYQPSLAFLEARKLCMELEEKYFPVPKVIPMHVCKVLPFRPKV